MMPARIRQTPLTKMGRDEIALEIACLEAMRRQAMADLERSGETRPNHEVAAIDQEIACLNVVLRESVEVPDDPEVVAVGCEFAVTDGQKEERFTIVGPLAANPRLGRISYESPLAQSALGGKVGDQIEPSGPGMSGRLRIAEVRRAKPMADLFN